MAKYSFVAHNSFQAGVKNYQ